MKNYKLKPVAAGVAIAVLSIGGAQAGGHTNVDEAANEVEAAAENTGEAIERSAAAVEAKAREFAKRFGVNELNDIEDAGIIYNGEEIGEVDRIGVDRATGDLLAIIGLNGILGVNMKEVAVPLSELEPRDDDDFSIGISKEELQKKRDIDPWTGTWAQVIPQ